MQRLSLLLLALAFAGGSVFPAPVLYRCAVTAQSVCCCGPSPSCRAGAGVVRSRSSAPRFQRVCCSPAQEKPLATSVSSCANLEGGWKKLLDDGRVLADLLPRAVFGTRAAPRQQAFASAGVEPHAPSIELFLAHCAFLI